MRQAAAAISVVGKAVLTLYPPLRPLSHNVNPRDGAQDISTSWPVACWVQRQRSQILTSASGDAIWGAHRPNYIRGQFGGIFFVPQVPPAPRCTPVVISTKLTSRLSLAPCCAGQPSFGHIQAAPRRALLPLDSIRRRSSQAKITDLTTVRTAGLLIKRAFKSFRGSMHALSRRGPRGEMKICTSQAIIGIQPPL